MNSLVNAIKNTVPITQFNRGLAGKIFEDVKKQGAKVVMKNNTPECVLMSPEEYLSLMEEVEDAKLLRLAESRLQNFTPAETIPAEDVYQKYGITDADLADFDEVELVILMTAICFYLRKSVSLCSMVLVYPIGPPFSVTVSHNAAENAKKAAATYSGLRKSRFFTCPASLLQSCRWWQRPDHTA